MKIIKKGIGIDGIFIAITRIVTMFLNIIVTKMLSINLTTIQYGTYSEALTIISLVSSISIFGLTDAAVYYYNKSSSEADRRDYLNSIFGIELIIGLAAALLMVALSKSISLFYSNSELALIIIAVSLQPIVDNYFSMLSALYIVKDKAGALTIRNGLASIMKLAVAAIGIFIFKSVLWILILILISSLIQLIIFWILYKKYHYFLNPFKINFNLVKGILTFGLSMSLIVVANSLLKQTDKIVIGYFSTEESIAIYENASKQLPFDIIITSLTTVASPMISKYILCGKKENLAKLLKSYLTLCFISTFILAIPSVIVSRQIMLFLYSEEYVGGNYIFIIYTMIEIVKFANLSIILITKNKKIELSLVTFGLLIINFIADFIMFKYFGSIGCAIVSLFISTLLSTYLIIRSSTLINIKIRNMINIKKILIVILESALILLISYFIRKFISKYISSSLVILLLIYPISIIGIIAPNARYLLYLFKELNSFNYSVEERQENETIPQQN